MKTILSPLRSDGALGVALVFKPEGQYCMCSLSHHLVLSHRAVVVVSWICTLAAYWHLTNMFSSHGARHTPHRHARTQLFRSSIRICQHWCCVRADVQPGVCAHHAFIVCVFIPRGTYFRRSFALSPFSTNYSLGYRAVCCWQGVHFFMYVSVEPASSMHTHKSDIQLRAHHRKSCETRDG